MAKYVVKNEFGEYLCEDHIEGSYWSCRDDENLRTWRYRAFARRRAKRVKGKVYRVRKLTARRERAALVELLKARRDAWGRGSVAWVELDLAMQAVERRGRNAER